MLGLIQYLTLTLLHFKVKIFLKISFNKYSPFIMMHDIES